MAVSLMHGHLTALSTYISVTCILYFVAPCFSDDGNRSDWRKPTICRKYVAFLITISCVEYT